MSNQIISYFPETHLGNGHDGLRKIALKHKKDPMNLKDGQFLLFINKAMTALKMYAAGNVLVHYKTTDGHRIQPQTISLLPKYFNGKSLNYKGALEQSVKADFARWKAKHI